MASSSTLSSASVSVVKSTVRVIAPAGEIAGDGDGLGLGDRLSRDRSGSAPGQAARDGAASGTAACASASS
jgi:hypothetical protein